MALQIKQAPAVDAPPPADRVRFLILRDFLRAEGDAGGVVLASAAYNGEDAAVEVCDEDIAARKSAGTWPGEAQAAPAVKA